MLVQTWNSDVTRRNGSRTDALNSTVKEALTTPKKHKKRGHMIINNPK